MLTSLTTSSSNSFGNYHSPVDLLSGLVRDVVNVSRSGRREQRRFVGGLGRVGGSADLSRQRGKNDPSTCARDDLRRHLVGQFNVDQLSVGQFSVGHDGVRHLSVGQGNSGSSVPG